MLLPAVAVDGDRVHLTFADHTDADLAYMAGSGPVFEPRRDREFIRQLTVDAEADTIEWPNDTHIAPEMLYAMVRSELDRPHRTNA